MASDERDDAARWEAVEEATELMVEGEMASALDRLRAVLRDDPENAYAYHYCGVALYELDQLEPARDAFRAATRLAPRYLAAWVALANTERLLGAPHEALRAAERALGLFPDDGDALHAAGLAAAAGGRIELARGYLERFLASRPELEAALEARTILALLAKIPEGQAFSPES